MPLLELEWRNIAWFTMHSLSTGDEVLRYNIPYEMDFKQDKKICKWNPELIHETMQKNFALQVKPCSTNFACEWNPEAICETKQHEFEMHSEILFHARHPTPWGIATLLSPPLLPSM